MAKKKQILYPVIFMVIITAVFTFVLAFINDVTKPTIEEQQLLAVQRSVLYVFDIPFAEDNDEAVTETFNTLIQTETVDDTIYYTFEENDSIKGYAVAISGKGLWGSITGHVAFSPDHTQILGVNFTAHSETPGLGGRIDEDEYKDQFRGITLNEAPYIAYGTSTGGNVDAISGATLTSLAVRDIYNNSLPDILKAAREEGFYEGN